MTGVPHATRPAAESLPAIEITIRGSQRIFLDTMAQIADESGSCRVERHFDPFGSGKLDIVNLRAQRGTVHLGGGGQLIAHADRPAVIAVEMRAEGWRPDPPTREAYVAFARHLIAPLLRRYNQMHGTRYRLRIEAAARPMAVRPRTRLLFDAFALLANTSSLHRLDWERFYRFARESRQDLPDHLLRAWLVDAGFAPDKADHLVEIHRHLRAFKRAP